MCSYFRWQTEQHAERVAELLEPFVTKGGEWNNRLRYMMEGRNLNKSRRYFDLCLRLLDNGTLDEAKDRFASNGTFWSMLYGFAEERAAWCAELAAHWLERRMTVAKSSAEREEWSWSLLNDDFGVEDLFTSARNAPAEFLQHVLPAVLRVAEGFKYVQDDEALSRDQVWPSRFRGEHISMSEAYLGACETALELLGQQSPDTLRPFITQLRAPKLYTANHLLMSAYLCNAAAFPDEVLRLLASEPRRLHCGYSDSAFWLSRQVIERCSPHCTEEVFRALEAVLLAFVSPHERTKDGMRCRGHAAYNLASALSDARQHSRTKTQIAAWREKFSDPDGPPRGIRSYSVVSPIEQESAQHMTDEQWLGAITKYNSAERRHDFEHPERGGAHELASMLQKFVKEQPERFAQLALRFPDDTQPSYFMNVLDGLKEATISTEKKLVVVRRMFVRNDKACLCAALDLLGEIKDTRLPDDAIQFVQRAAQHSDPESELWDGERPYYGGDILTHGINTVRGHAAGTIRNLIDHDSSHLADFSAVIEKLVTDPSLAVRSVVASMLAAVARHDTPLVLRLLDRLLNADDRLLATPYVREFIQRGLREHFAHFAPTIERMLHSTRNEVKKQGGILACLARLYHKAADTLSEMALSGDESCRLGACEVAKSNLLHTECRAWCEPTLLRLFSDGSKAVRTQAAGCFWHHWHSPDTALTDYDSLIRSFLESPAFADEPTFLLHALEDTRRRVPEVTLDVCEAFITRCAEGARDIRTSLAADEHTIGKLVFTAYAQLQSQGLQARALDVIDQMSMEGFRSASSHLSEFER